MHFLRRARFLVSFTLAWFVLSLGVAVASPLIQPKAMLLVCTSAGAVKVVVQTDGDAQDLGAGHMDCPLCAITGAPPPAPPVASLPQVQPVGLAVQPIPAARIAAATAAPLPARGPPLFA